MLEDDLEALNAPLRDDEPTWDGVEFVLSAELENHPPTSLGEE